MARHDVMPCWESMGLYFDHVANRMQKQSEIMLLWKKEDI